MRLRKRQRLTLVVLAVLLVGGATGLVLAALSDSVAFFVTPSEIAAGKVDEGKRFRIGGLVVEGSVQRDGGHEIGFALTDTASEVKVVYAGILPDLFREGQGIVAQGTLRPDGIFAADEVLAKHDENYMPKEVADALKRCRRLAGRQRRTPMIAELGHYALVLAFGLALVQGTLPLWGAARGDPALMGLRAERRGRSALALTLAFAALIYAFVVSDFSVAGRRQLALDQAAALQDQRRLGQPRGLDAALGADPGAVRRRGRALRAQPAARRSAPACWRCRG